MSYPDYNTRYATVSGDSWSAAEARKKITAPFPIVYVTHATGLSIAWNPVAYTKDPAKKASMEDAVAAFYAKGLFMDMGQTQNVAADSAVIRSLQSCFATNPIVGEATNRAHPPSICP